MDKYIGFKMLQAEPMTNEEFCEHGINRGNPNETHGYKVVYEGGYTSWSPKDVFDASHMKVSEKNTITIENVNSFVDSFETTQLGDKTTVVKATLKNGFIIVESSSCVDAANYDEIIGRDICKERIYNKIWELLGFLLQTAKDGVK